MMYLTQKVKTRCALELAAVIHTMLHGDFDTEHSFAVSTCDSVISPNLFPSYFINDFIDVLIFYV